MDDICIEEERIRLNAFFTRLIWRGGTGAERSRVRTTRRDAESADALVADDAPDCIGAIAELHAESAGEPLHGEWRFMHATLRMPGAELRFDVRDGEEGTRDALRRGAQVDGLVAHHVTNAFVVECRVDAATVRRGRIETNPCEPRHRRKEAQGTERLAEEGLI